MTNVDVDWAEIKARILLGEFMIVPATNISANKIKGTRNVLLLNVILLFTAIFTADTAKRISVTDTNNSNLPVSVASKVQGRIKIGKVKQKRKRIKSSNLLRKFMSKAFNVKPAGKIA